MPMSTPGPHPVLTEAMRLEADARQVLGLNLSYLPAPLHTPDVAEIHTMSGAQTAQHEQWRKQFLAGPSGRYHLIVGIEALIKLRAFGRDLFDGQLAHLLELMGRHHVAVRILTFGAVAPIPSSPLLILRDIPGHHDRGYVPYYPDWVTTSRSPEVMFHAWQQACDAAVTTEETVRYLDHMHAQDLPMSGGATPGLPTAVGDLAAAPHDPPSTTA